MRVLLDTQILLWQFSDDPRLHGRLLDLVLDESISKFASDVSLWEAAIKIRTGRLEVDLTEFEDSVSQQGYPWLSVERRHFHKLSEIPPIHRDPFDHLLIAQALCDDLHILTADEKFALYPVKLALGAP